MRTFALSSLSFALTILVFGNAFFQKKQFYPSIVYLTKSNSSTAVLYLQGIVLIYLLGKTIARIFFGQLRPTEVEHLIERGWYAITETCLAFAAFRDDLSFRFFTMFTLLLFIKCFHWLAEDRVDFMERSPVITRVFHLRAMGVLTCLCLLDAAFIRYAYRTTLARGASVQLVFGFEYAILFVFALGVWQKYILHAIDSRSDEPWDRKAILMLWGELVLSAASLLLYAMFIFIMLRVHAFPLFAIRPAYTAFRSFKLALSDMVLSRRAIRIMQQRYPDATAEDLSSSDNVCIICREEMLPDTGSAFFLPSADFSASIPAAPAPLLPDDLKQLSEAELRRMEAWNREALERRVEHLQRISALLDAAVLQMGQYTQLMARIGPPPPLAEDSQAGASAAAASAPAAGSAAEATANSTSSK
uniref:RING-type E3 ubiquitin transferase n=1 Tax=Macrostomum lignano TaxID=282301 RepID=A0A1I8HDF5_9PLAT